MEAERVEQRHCCQYCLKVDVNILIAIYWCQYIDFDARYCVKHPQEKSKKNWQWQTALKLGSFWHQRSLGSCFCSRRDNVIHQFCDKHGWTNRIGYSRSLIHCNGSLASWLNQYVISRDVNCNHSLASGWWHWNDNVDETLISIWLMPMIQCYCWLWWDNEAAAREHF